VIDLRLRTRIPPAELEEKVGNVLTEDDFNVLLTRACRVRKPDGRLLCVYLPAAVPVALRDRAWPILYELRKQLTDNRGQAAGTRIKVLEEGTRSRTRQVSSSIIGAFENTAGQRYCRLTAWTGRETEKFRLLRPLIQFIGYQLRDHVPDRYQAQMEEVTRTHPDWVIPGTPFTTVTVNNTWETSVHTDKGDLDKGFSTLAVLRRGSYRGGHLVFPEYRVAVEMRDGDLLLMDAHDWHGNTFLDPRPIWTRTGRRIDKHGYDRISVVCYYRTAMVGCGPAASEEEKRQVLAEQRNRARVGEV
jgi:Oxygenase domain of the 2OGFeDO superfamily